MLVSCEGQRWLPEVLAAVAAQTRRPDDVRAVDAASRDDTALLLQELLPSAPLAVQRRAGFLDAVRAALAAADADRLAHDAARAEAAAAAAEPSEAAPAPTPTPAPDWVWLLHDDGAPAPDALERLLAAVEVAPSVGIAGCKLREWDDPALLQEAGFSTSPLGRRLTGVEAGDADQGQRDDRDDVLAVSTAGMLVRADLLEALGGDPALPVLGEDLDLCRRARLAGARVIVVPGAVVRHADATRRGQRPTPASRAPRWTDRRHRTHGLLAGAALPLLPLVALAALAGGVLRALGRMATKQPDRAPAELTAVLAALLRPGRLWTARRAAARTRRLPRRALRPLLAGRREVLGWHRDRVARRTWLPGAGEAPDAEPPPVTEAAAAERRRGQRTALAALLAVLTAASALGQHRLVGRGDLVGGALAPAPSLGELWRAARTPWQPAGLGSSAAADPWLSVLWALSVPAGASPGLAVTALVLLAPPLAGLGGWVAAGALTRSVPLRAAAGLAWAAAPPLTAAVATGRIAALVAHLALPWAALGLARAATSRSRRRALPAAAGAGLAACAAVAGAPALLLVLLALPPALVLLRRWSSPLAWALLAPVAVLGPLLAPALADPRVLLADPSWPVPTAPAPSWQLLLGAPQAVASPLVLLPGALLAAAALAALGARSRPSARAGAGRAPAPASRLGWALAAAGLAVALVAGRTAVTTLDLPAGTGQVPAVTGWAGAGTSLLLLGLGVVALDGAARLAAALAGPAPALVRARAARGPRTALATGTALALLAPALALGAAAAAQLAGEQDLRRVQPAAPTVARDAAASPDAVRTLVLDLADDGSAAASLQRGGASLADASAVRAASRVEGPLARPSTGAPDAAEQALRSAAAVLVAGRTDPRPLLADLGVGFVLARTSATAASTSSGAPADGSSPLDAVPGLARAGAAPAGVLHRVVPASGGGADAPDRPARARLLAADGTVVTALPSSGADVVAQLPPAPEGAGGRTVVLAERADPGWRATLDGRPLRSVQHAGWAAAFEVPAQGGSLEVVRSDPEASAWTVLQGLVLLLTGLLAVPVPGARRRPTL
ncbi:glycosyltransferase [Quadrisphaera sp. DSM 44207]|uniref:glycosyltransferase n=1 Tax=Quadrisphaera sp. DSM 44207 TaxID=1881057 RepID=UPI00115F8557|nr:glycosyltransferase [Quadrisphaera sp. DSM 44207]